MSEALTESIKTRVPPSIKRGFKRIAKARHLKVSDIHREAFREYLKSREVTPTTPASEVTESENGKAVTA